MRVFLALVFLSGSFLALGAEREERVECDGTIYRTFIARPMDVQIFWLNENGKPIR